MADSKLDALPALASPSAADLVYIVHAAADYRMTYANLVAGLVPTTVQVIAGTGLTGGGALSGNVTLTVSYGTTAGTACQGDDSRLSDARAAASVSTSTTTAITGLIKGAAGNLAAAAAGTDYQAPYAILSTLGALANSSGYLQNNGSGGLSWAAGTGGASWGSITGTLSAQTDLNTALSGKAANTVTITAGTGLTGGGDLSANRTLTVAYGTSSTTACVGDDARLSDARAAASVTVGTTTVGTGSGGVLYDNGGTLGSLATTGTGNVIRATALTASNVGLGSVTNDAQTKAAIVPNTAPTAGQVLVGNAGGTAYAPASVSGDVTLASTGAATIAAGAVTESKVTLADVTTLNVSTTKHGLVPKAPNDATQYLDGTGAWSVPAGGGGGGAPTGAQYVTLATDAGLSAERVLATGVSLRIADGGPNGNATLYQVRPSVAEGRLTLATGDSAPVADQSAAGTLYYTPHTGTQISLYDGSAWKIYTFAEISLSLSVTSGKNYDVWLYDNGGTLTLELGSAWTSDTTRADAAPVLQDGAFVKSGATTRRWVGTIRASGTNKCSDTAILRYVWNAQNRVNRSLRLTDSTASWTWNTPSWRKVRAAAGTYAVEAVVGSDRSYLDLSAVATFTASANQPAGAAIGEDADTPAAEWYGGLAFCNATKGSSAGRLSKRVPLGYHQYRWLEYGNTTNTITFYGADATPVGRPGLIGHVEA